jgi:hypothetical protein
MLKKLIATSAVLAFFACTSDNPTDGNPSSSSQSGTDQSSSDGGSSSSSEPEGPIIEETKILIASFNGGNAGKSPIFNTYGYGYTMKAGEEENLKQFWKMDDPDCPTTKQSNTPPSKCELDKTNAILQNKLTSKGAPLHYKVDEIGAYPQYAIVLQGYNLTEEGDQAALGLNVGADEDEGKSIGELNNHKIDGAIAFTYKYSGGAHIFRAAASDENFWYKEIPAVTDTVDVKVYVRDFAGMGSFAGEEGEDTPFDLSQVAKFLWVVEYNEEGTNQGSLLIDDFNAVVERAVER